MERERARYARMGRDDVASAIEIEDLIEDVGYGASVTAIKSYAVASPSELDDVLDFPKQATADQKKQLVDAWASGWAEHGHELIEAHLRKRAADLIFYEGPLGLREVGWHVSPEKGAVIGPFDTKEEALKRAMRALEEA